MKQKSLSQEQLQDNVGENSCDISLAQLAVVSCSSLTDDDQLPQPFDNGLPDRHWSPMASDENLKIVRLTPSEDDVCYTEVENSFYNSMNSYTHQIVQV